MRRRLEPPDVLDFEVPVCVRDMSCLAVKNWDFTVQRILPHIDGVKYVKMVALDSDVDLYLVRQTLRQLLYYECIWSTYFNIQIRMFARPE